MSSVAILYKRHFRYFSSHRKIFSDHCWWSGRLTRISLTRTSRHLSWSRSVAAFTCSTTSSDLHYTIRFKHQVSLKLPFVALHTAFTDKLYPSISIFQIASIWIRFFKLYATLLTVEQMLNCIYLWVSFFYYSLHISLWFFFGFAISVYDPCNHYNSSLELYGKCFNLLMALFLCPISC